MWYREDTEDIQVVRNNIGLMTEIMDLQVNLVRAESALKFYANKNNWGVNGTGRVIFNSDDLEKDSYGNEIGGKKARQYFEGKGK